jgi:hypothetical protein
MIRKRGTNQVRMAGRFTLAQSSWTASARSCSRKWMSGHAASALVLLEDRVRFAPLAICQLGEPILPRQEESPFPVDFYLSWMSTKPHDLCQDAGLIAAASSVR